MSALITWLLSVPAVRLFLEDIVIRVWAEVMVSSRDPEFQKRFIELAGGLAGADTEEAKRAILKQIRDLRGGAQ